MDVRKGEMLLCCRDLKGPTRHLHVAVQQVLTTLCVRVQQVLEKDGVRGLLFRGLSTKILANGMQARRFACPVVAVLDAIIVQPLGILL